MIFGIKNGRQIAKAKKGEIIIRFSFSTKGKRILTPEKSFTRILPTKSFQKRKKRKSKFFFWRKENRSNARKFHRREISIFQKSKIYKSVPNLVRIF